MSLTQNKQKLKGHPKRFQHWRCSSTGRSSRSGSINLSKDTECPGKPSFEDLCEQLDSGELRPMSLRHFGSRNEDDEAETGNIRLAKSGVLKIKKAKVETANPTNLEEFRSKIMLMINHFVFARFRFPNKDVLKNVNPFTSLEYLNYLCGKDVSMMEAQTVEGTSLHRPSLKLIMR